MKLSQRNTGGPGPHNRLTRANLQPQPAEENDGAETREFFRRDYRALTLGFAWFPKPTVIRLLLLELEEGAFG